MITKKQYYSGFTQDYATTMLPAVCVVGLVIVLFGFQFGLFHSPPATGFLIMAGGWALVWLSSYRIDQSINYQFTSYRAGDVLYRIHILAYFLAVVAGTATCAVKIGDSNKYMEAFERTIETGGMIAPDVQYNGNEKAISMLDGYSNKFVPGGWAAKNPEDVRYVVVVTEQSYVVGHYEGGGNAIRIDYDVEIIDLYPYSVLASMTFQGSNPPEVTSGSRGSGKPPKTEVIVAFVESVLQD